MPNELDIMLNGLNDLNIFRSQKNLITCVHEKYEKIEKNSILKKPFVKDNIHSNEKRMRRQIKKKRNKIMIFIMLYFTFPIGLAAGFTAGFTAGFVTTLTLLD